MFDFNFVKLIRKPEKLAIEWAKELKNSSSGHKVMAINILEIPKKLQLKLKIIKPME